MSFLSPLAVIMSVLENISSSHKRNYEKDLSRFTVK